MDRINARTNKPGISAFDELRSKVSDGQVKGDEPFSVKPYHYEDLRSVLVEYQDKAYPRKGNHVDPLQYGRSIFKVTTDAPFREYHESVFSHNGEIQYQYTTDDHISRGHTPFSFAPFTLGLDEDGLETEATTKALLDIGNSKAQLAVDIAEVKRTGDMLASAVLTGLDVFRQVKKGNLAGAAAALGLTPSQLARGRGRRQANQWLAYSYGWKPLAGTIYDLTQLLNEKMSGEFFLHGEGYASGSHQGDSSDVDSQIHWQNKIQHKVVLGGKIASPALHTLSQIGVVNPLSIAWELVPWSFAIDWFMPVGNTLEAMTSTMGVNFHRGWQSKKMNYQLDISKKIRERYRDSYGTTFVRVDSPGTYQERGHRFFRGTFGDWPKAGFYADSTPFSTPRALNALALVRQLKR